MVQSLKFSNPFIAVPNAGASPPQVPERLSTKRSSPPDYATTPPPTQQNSSLEPARFSSATTTKQLCSSYSWFAPGVVISWFLSPFIYSHHATYTQLKCFFDMSVCINVYSHLSENFHPSLDIARNLTTNHCVVIPQTNNIHKLFFFFLSQLQLGKRLECFMAKIVKFHSLYRLK